MVIDKYTYDEKKIIVWHQASYWLQTTKFFIMYDEDEERVYQRPKIEYWMQNPYKPLDIFVEPVVQVESFCTKKEV